MIKNVYTTFINFQKRNENLFDLNLKLIIYIIYVYIKRPPGDALDCFILADHISVHGEQGFEHAIVMSSSYDNTMLINIRGASSTVFLVTDHLRKDIRASFYINIKCKKNNNFNFLSLN